MKITEVVTHHLAYAVGHPYRNCCSDWVRSRPATLVEIRTDNGLTGWGEGEGFPSGADIAEHVIGRDPFDYESIFDLLSHQGRSVNTACGIEIALWDLMGKSLDKPVHQLLGEARRDRVVAYASGFFKLKDVDHIERVVEEANRCCDAGFRAIKIRIGFGGELDERLVAAVRGAIRNPRGRRRVFPSRHRRSVSRPA